MLFTITAKHINLTEAIKDHAEERTSKLPRYYSSINQIEVILDGQPGGKIKAEIIARATHNKVFVVTEIDQDAYRCIDFAVRKLERRLRKIKGKERDNKHAGGSKLG